MSMQLDMFPSMKEKELDNKMNDELKVVEDTWVISLSNYFKTPHIPEKATKVVWVLVAGAIGGFIWFMRCCGYALEELFTCKSVEYVLWDLTFGSFMVHAGICMLLCLLILILYENRIKLLDQRASNKLMSEADISEQKKQKIIKKYEELKLNYTAEFSKRVKSLSIQYANSVQVKNVADCMMDFFPQIIDEADRSSNIERVEVQLYFRVFIDSITFSAYGGERLYSFERNRVDNLKGCCEQEAIARAIGSEIINRIMAMYPDENGVPIIGCNYTMGYTENLSADVYIIYKAWNSNFRNLQSW